VFLYIGFENDGQMDEVNAFFEEYEVDGLVSVNDPSLQYRRPSGSGQASVLARVYCVYSRDLQPTQFFLDCLLLAIQLRLQRRRDTQISRPLSLPRQLPLRWEQCSP
jgi:hypothetical protein